MLIPIRCFTCGKVLADKYDYYIKEAQKLEEKDNVKHFDKQKTGSLLDDMGLTRYCCRRHMIATVDMMETI